MTRELAKEYINGQTAMCMKEIERMARELAKAYSNGQMEICMKEI